MSDVYVNALTTISNEPTSTDSLVCVNRNTNEGQIIDYSLLAGKVLDKLTSKSFSSLTTTSKQITGAINELDADSTSLNTKVNAIKQTFAATANSTTNIDFTTSVGNRRLMVLGHASDTGLCGAYLLIDTAVIPIVSASLLTVTTDGTKVTIVNASTNRNANGIII